MDSASGEAIWIRQTGVSAESWPSDWNLVISRKEEPSLKWKFISAVTTPSFVGRARWSLFALGWVKQNELLNVGQFFQQLFERQIGPRGWCLL